MFFETLTEYFHVIQKISGLVRCRGCCLKTLFQMRKLKFVDVVYDDFHGIKRPIGLIHEMPLPNGQTREVFTFCCAGKRQPGLALFVARRTGNMADQIALTFDGQDIIPAYVKQLPEFYKEKQLRFYAQPIYRMAG